MKKQFRFLLLLVMLPLTNYAQLRTVIFDDERSLFDGGNSLPAEEMFFVTGTVRPDIELVEVELYKGNFKKRIYASRWERPFGSSTEQFQALFKYKLAGSSDYDLRVQYFRPVTEKEKTQLDSALNAALGEYVNQSVGKGNRLIKSADRVVDDLNTMVTQGTSLYRSKNLIDFQGFSDIVRAKYRALESGDMRGAAAAGASEDKGSRGGLGSVLEDIKRTLRGEVRQLLATDLTVAIISKEIDKYPTENTMNPVALNIGYGAAYIEGSNAQQNLVYGRSVITGISFPLSSVGTAPNFLRNTSISAGVFWPRYDSTGGKTVYFKDNANRPITGPLIDRPIYLAAGYKVLNIVRINAGAAFLQRAVGTGNSKEILISPMISISAEVGLWLGLGKK